MRRISPVRAVLALTAVIFLSAAVLAVRQSAAQPAPDDSDERHQIVVRNGVVMMSIATFQRIGEVMGEMQRRLDNGCI